MFRLIRFRSGGRVAAGDSVAILAVGEGTAGGIFSSCGMGVFGRIGTMFDAAGGMLATCGGFVTWGAKFGAVVTGVSGAAAWAVGSSITGAGGGGTIGQVACLDTGATTSTQSPG